MDKIKLDDFWKLIEEKNPELFLNLALGQEVKEYYREIAKETSLDTEELQEEIERLEGIIDDVKHAVRYA